MKCKIIHNPKNIPSFEDFEKIEEFEYDGVLELLQKVYQPPDNICWVLDCENGKLYRSENNVFLELGIVNGFINGEIMQKQETTYFKITSHFGAQRDDYSNVIMVVESSTDLKSWKQIYKSNNHLELISWLSSMILLNELENNYHVLADYYISNQIATKIFENKNHYKNQIRELNLKEEDPVNLDGLNDLVYGETDYDDEEITKDLMLDEVISSQRLEIEKLEEIIKEFSNQNLKLTNIIETNSTIIKQQNEYIRILQTESQKILLNVSNWLIKEQII